jgi:hypothetical protein
VVSVEYYKDSAGGFRFRVKGGNGEIVATSESYTRKRDAKRGYKALVDIVTEPQVQERACGLCGGEGRTDSNADRSERAPWSFWETLPPGSDIAVRLGLVKPMDCSDCGGTGKVPA